VQVFTPLRPQTKTYLRDSPLVRGTMSRGLYHPASIIDTIDSMPDDAIALKYLESLRRGCGFHDGVDDTVLRSWPQPQPQLSSILVDEEMPDENLEEDNENAIPHEEFVLPTVGNRPLRDDETSDKGLEEDEEDLTLHEEPRISTPRGVVEETREGKSVKGEEEEVLVREVKPNIPTLLAPPEETQDDALQIGHPRFSELRIRGHPRRPRSRKSLTRRREPGPDKIPSATLRGARRIARSRASSSVFVGTPRRSARLAAKDKPFEVFHRYADLPVELRWMIWEAVAANDGRLVGIYNRWSTLGYANKFGIENKLPHWFMTCRLSAHVASRIYKKLFASTILEEEVDDNDTRGAPPSNKCLTDQHVFPSADIIVYEPCHGGCRAYYCARQYDQKDRDQVRYLAVQIDSPYLSPRIAPGWETVSAAWPNVETLYMMKRVLRRSHPEEMAMLRISEGPHELTLRERFEGWKKQSPLGQSSKLIQLEFVMVVRKELATTGVMFRYQSVMSRRTGHVQDIILG
jgi:hypothetical protein